MESDWPTVVGFHFKNKVVIANVCQPILFMVVEKVALICVTNLFILLTRNQATIEINKQKKYIIFRKNFDTYLETLSFFKILHLISYIYCIVSDYSIHQNC